MLNNLVYNDKQDNLFSKCRDYNDINVEACVDLNVSGRKAVLLCALFRDLIRSLKASNTAGQVPDGVRGSSLRLVSDILQSVVASGIRNIHAFVEPSSITLSLIRFFIIC